MAGNRPVTINAMTRRVVTPNRSAAFSVVNMGALVCMI